MACLDNFGCVNACGVVYIPSGAEIGYEVAADNAIYMIENDVLGGSGWPKAFRHTLARSPDQVGAVGGKGVQDGWLMKALEDTRWMITVLDLERGRRLVQRWAGVLVALYQHASDSENTNAMLQLGNLLYYGAHVHCQALDRT